MSSPTHQMPLRQCHPDRGINLRAGGLYDDAINEAILDLRIALAEGAKIPPPVVFRPDNDARRDCLADGVLRWYAHEQEGCAYIDVEVKPGTRLDALLYSIQANAGQNQARFGRKDRRRVVNLLLDDPVSALWSNRQIAATAGVDEGTVRNIKKERCGNSALQNDPEPDDDEEQDKKDKDADEAKLREQLWRLGNKEVRKRILLGQLPDWLAAPQDTDRGQLVQRAWARLVALREDLDDHACRSQWMELLTEAERLLTGMVPAEVRG